MANAPPDYAPDYAPDFTLCALIIMERIEDRNNEF